MICRALLLVLVFAASGAATAGAAEPWPRFRGPNADGISADDPRLPEVWSTETAAWVAELPGYAWSNPVVWGDRVFVSTVASDETSEENQPKAGLFLGEGVREPEPGVHHWLVYCFDLHTGEKLWEREAHVGEPTVPRHPKASYASETPTTDGERLYVLFGDLGLYCYNLDGELLWTHAIEPKKTFYDYGAAASPVVHDGHVIFVYDNQEDSYVASLDAKSGGLQWRISRDELSTWATPFIWEHEQRTEVVVNGREKNRSYNLAGELLWEFDGDMSNLVIPSPFAAHGLLYITSGYVGDAHRPVYAVRPGATGDFTLAEGETANDFIAWYQPTAGPYNPSPIVYGDYYYTLYDRGFLTCHDARTGEEVYGKQRFPDGASFTASPWAYNGKLFCLTENGDTFVVAAGPEFELLHTNPLDELSLATPAVSDGRLLVRTASRLYCFTNAAE